MSSKRGFSLVEMLIASIIMAVMGIPLISVFISSKQSVVRTDGRREVRYYMREIYAHLGRQSLHDLWRWVGPSQAMAPEGKLGPGLLNHRIADFDDKTGQLTGRNPFGFSPEFIKEMVLDGVDARVFFEFYTRKELEVSPATYNPNVQDSPSPKYGIFHMQAGWAQVYILDLKKLHAGATEQASVMAEWKEPVMCPAIVGRPGLKLSGCPAVNVVVRAQYEPLLRKREALLN